MRGTRIDTHFFFFFYHGDRYLASRDNFLGEEGAGGVRILLLLVISHHLLQDAVLHQCLPLSSVCCFPVPGGSLLPCYVAGRRGA